MKNRIIGGIGWILLLVITYVTGIYDQLNILFLIVGIYEIMQMYLKKPNNFAILYAFIFAMGIFSLNLIYNTSEPVLLFLIISIMLCDTFAYLTGKQFGKHHFSKISPNKTIEGLVGGISVTIIIGMLLVNFVPYFGDAINIHGINFLLLMFLTLTLGIVGDLFESKLKRVSGVKDSGNIIYGHGGILDRIDSWVLAAIPVALIVILIGV